MDRSEVHEMTQAMLNMVSEMHAWISSLNRRGEELSATQNKIKIVMATKLVKMAFDLLLEVQQNLYRQEQEAGG